MPHSELIRKYFSAYENRDRKAVESLLTNDFTFTSPYDRRIERETYFKRCWPYSEKSPTYGTSLLPRLRPDYLRGQSLYAVRRCSIIGGSAIR